MNSKVYKWCVVPQCPNTSTKTPSKLFVYIPQKKNVRDKWLSLARRDPADITIKSTVYMCEDHFDLPQDMENYMEYYLMGSVSKVRTKPGCMPTKFNWQPDRKSRTSNPIERQFVAKKRRKMVVEECDKYLEENIIVPQHSESDHVPTESAGITMEIKTEFPDDYQMTWKTDGSSYAMNLEDPLSIDDKLLKIDQIQMESCNESIVQKAVYSSSAHCSGFDNENPFECKYFVENDPVIVPNTDNFKVKHHRCDICDETFDVENNYKMHLRTHDESPSVIVEEEESLDSNVDSPPLKRPTIRRCKNSTEVLAGGETVNDAPSTPKETINSRIRIQEDDECDLHGKIIAKKLRKLSDNERVQVLREIYNMFLRHEKRARPAPSPAYSYNWVVSI